MCGIPTGDPHGRGRGEGCDSSGTAKARQHDIMRGLFKDSGSLSVDKFVQRAQQLSNVRQLELMGDGELTLRTLR